MIAYVDASMLVKLFVDEEGADVARDLWLSDAPMATARISQIEVACALGAAVRAGRADPDVAGAATLGGDFLWQRADAVEASALVVDEAACIGYRRGLRAVDALHVASALALGPLGPALVSWDRAQREVAAAEGLPVYP